MLNRQKQEVFVKEEIYKLIPKDKEYILGDIFSISTHTAKKGLDSSDNELFEDSNIPKFYELLTDVIKDKASKLKADTPYEGLKSFIDFNILGSDIIKQNSSIKNIKLQLSSLDPNSEEYTSLNSQLSGLETNLNNLNTMKMFSKEIK